MTLIRTLIYFQILKFLSVDLLYSSVKETEQLRSPEDDCKLNTNNLVIIIVLLY